MMPHMRTSGGDVGTQSIRHAEITHYRWVHNNDFVTRVPPVWLGYRHCGSEIYLDRHGRIRKLRGLFRSRDRWRGFVAGLWKWKLDMLSDHSIGQYAGHIATAVDAELDASPHEHDEIRPADIAMRSMSSALPSARATAGEISRLASATRATESTASGELAPMMPPSRNAIW